MRLGDERLAVPVDFRFPEDPTLERSNDCKNCFPCASSKLKSSAWSVIA